jgi:hypothetical protein
MSACWASARHGDSLAHAARQLVRHPVAEAGQVDESEQPLDLAPALIARSPCDAQRQLDVAGGRQPREQRGLLEEQARPAVDHDLATRRPVELGDQVEQRALAATRGTDKAQELAAARRQRDALERQDVIAARAVRLAHATDAEHRVPELHLSGRRVRGAGGHGCTSSGRPASRSTSLSSARS